MQERTGKKRYNKTMLGKGVEAGDKGKETVEGQKLKEEKENQEKWTADMDER